MRLIIPAKPDLERDAVADAWEKRGGEIVRLDRFWEVPPDLPASEVALYGNDTFCLVVAEKFRVNLLSPDDRLLATAPRHLLNRDVRLKRLADLTPADFPVFVKPAIPKQFRGAVYPSQEALVAECKGLAGSTDVLVSEIVSFQAEARAFALDRVVQACTIYEGEGRVDDAAACAASAVLALDLPRTCVVDVGRIDGNTWVLIELNATWGAGLNGCPA